MVSKEVAAIIVTYNRKILLKECIEALLVQSKREILDIIVIDNASTDGTYDYIKDLLDKNECIKYKNTGSNLGGAGGYSFGMKFAMQTYDYKYLWIMDDDTIPRFDALENLLIGRDLVDDQFGFLASTVAWTDDSFCKMNQITIKCPEWSDYYKLIEKGMILVQRATFVSILVRGAVVREVGLPIKEFFIWGDDKEYTDRISKKYQCFYVASSKVIHKMNTNVGSCLKDDEETRIKRYEYAFRNDLYIARRNGFRESVIYFANILKTFVEIILFSPSKKCLRIKTLLVGMLKGLFFHPPIEYLKDKSR